MPELPEVETIVRDLNQTITAKTFSRIIVRDSFVLRQGKDDFTKRIKGRTVVTITRRGKAVIIHLKPKGFLVVQLMMTGQLIVDASPDRHTRVIFNFSDGTKLLYNDQRRFGQLRSVDKLEEIPHFNNLGPEPLSKDFTPALMRELFKNTSRPIKNVLLDHTFVAGIGNSYACEILFRSALSPKRPAKMIKLKEAETLHRLIIEVLNEAILHRGSSMRNYRDASGQKGRFNERLSVYAREGEPCLVCHQAIGRITQAGRSTFYCGHCQKK